MKVLAVNGSHRPGHNTATMLNRVLEVVKEEGFETELIELYEQEIKLCTSCNKCLMKPECSIRDDDMPMIVDKLLAADAIILGSPVYFGNVSSMMKIFIDRSRSMHMCKNALDGKIGAALTHAGLRNGGQEMTQMILERFLQCHGLRVVEARDPETGIFNGGPLGTMFDSMDEKKMKWKKDVSEDTLTIKTCSSLGKNIVRTLKKK